MLLMRYAGRRGEQENSGIRSTSESPDRYFTDVGIDASIGAACFSFTMTCGFDILVAFSATCGFKLLYPRVTLKRALTQGGFYLRHLYDAGKED